MNLKLVSINLLFLLAACLITYIIVRETTHYEIVGKVVSNQTVVENNPQGYEEDNYITIERVDGTKVLYDNTDDFFIRKSNSHAISRRLKDGQLVEIVVNGFGNIINVTWLQSHDETNSVVHADK